GPTMKTSTLILVILLAALLLTAGGAFYVLQEGHQAVVLQFGRPVGGAVTEAGLHFKVPFIQEVRRFDKRLLIWDGDPNQIPTEGREFILVDSTARWRIVDPLKFLESVATEAGAQSRLDDIIDSVVRDLVSANPLVELVRSSSWTTPEGEVLQEAPKELVEELKKEINLGREGLTRAVLSEVRKTTPQYGIEVVDVRIKRLNYVESVRKKVYARMISERKRIAARFRSEGEGRSAEILGNMERELREIRSGAYRRVQEIRGKGDAEATKIYGVAYGKDPEFYAFSRTLEALKDSDNQNSVLVLTTESDYYKYLKKTNPTR
ncbi:MAG TPA: protease modulator HflC, partial [Terriglobales bacterium]|nr:protease modulator HflC [Terriglobales bacterium]